MILKGISKEITAVLKIFAILCVLVEHIARAYWGMNERMANCFGTGGVALFLFLSGYGLYQSAKQHGITTVYWQKKIQKVLFPYWLVTIMYVVLCRIQVSAPILLQNLLTVDYNRSIDGTMWYLSLLVLFYIAFGILFWAQIPTWGRVVLLFIVAAAVGNSTMFGSCSWQFQQSNYIFPLGVAAAWLLDIFCQYARKCPKIQMLICCVLSVCCVAMYVFNAMRQAGFAILNIWLVGACLFLGVIASSMLHLTRQCKKMLNTLGALTYPVYLVEGKVIDTVNKVAGLQHAWLATLLDVLLILVISVFLYLLIQQINQYEKENNHAPS